jgi:hypothetical protein
MDLTIGVPGLYWINFFSSGYAEWLGIANLPKQLWKLKQLSQGGMSLRFCDFPDHCRSLEVLQRQRAAIKWLGAEKFFDIRFPDRKAVTPDWSLIPLQCSAHLP